MKTLMFIFVLFGFLFISQEDVFAQKKSKKIETWKVYHESTSFLDMDSYQVAYKCSITLTNNSSYHISKVTLKLIIKDKNDVTIYKRKHTIQVDLDPGETGGSKVFNLYEKVFNANGFDNDGVTVSSEIISVN